MNVRIRICDRWRWHTIAGAVPAGSDTECYALPPKSCRWRFWGEKLGMQLPRGHVMVWEAA
jgi:hypothetical protein